MEQLTEGRGLGMEMHGQQSEASRAQQECQGRAGDVCRASQDQPRKTLAQMLGFDTIHSGLLVFFHKLQSKGRENRIKCTVLKHVNQFMELKEHGGKN